MAVSCVILWRKHPALLQVLRYGSVTWPKRKVSVWAAITWTDPRIQLRVEALWNFYYSKYGGKTPSERAVTNNKAIRSHITKNVISVSSYLMSFLYYIHSTQFGNDMLWSVYGVVTWPTLGHHTKLPLDGRRNETNILIYNILSRKQGSNPTTLKLKTMRWDEAPICHRKLKNIHSQALTPLRSNVVFFTVRYNSPVTIMTSYIRSKSQHHSFCFPISKNRSFSGPYRGCLNGLV